MVLFKKISYLLYMIFFFMINYGFARLNKTKLNCLIGPNYWCLNNTTKYLCDIKNISLGLCGYKNRNCPLRTGDEFCTIASSSYEQSPFEYNGGLTGANEDYFSYYILSLYWPPSNCPLIYNETNDLLNYFCSPYTDHDQAGRQRLVLHGLWPTFSTYGNYQGWPQFCSSKYKDWSYCHINGNLCPWKNTKSHDFTQSHYEYCLSKENIEKCLVNEVDILQPEYERLKILAPGYLNKFNLFMNHEWTKHGSCCSSIFGNNISNYLAYMLDLTDLVTRPNSLIYEYIQRYAGEKIGLRYLISVLNETFIINCNSKCELQEIWICFDRDQHTGLPTKPMTCPSGARYTSDSCRKARCEYVSIPMENIKIQLNTSSDSHIPEIVTKLIFVIIIFLILKFILIFCGGFYSVIFYSS